MEEFRDVQYVLRKMVADMVRYSLYSLRQTSPPSLPESYEPSEEEKDRALLGRRLDCLDNVGVTAAAPVRPVEDETAATAAVEVLVLSCTTRYWSDVCKECVRVVGDAPDNDATT